MVRVVSLKEQKQKISVDQPCKDVVLKKKTVMKQEMFLTESLTNFILTFSDGKTVRFKVLFLKPTVLVTLF